MDLKEKFYNYFEIFNDGHIENFLRYYDEIFHKDFSIIGNEDEMINFEDWRENCIEMIEDGYRVTEASISNVEDKGNGEFHMYYSLKILYPNGSLFCKLNNTKGIWKNGQYFQCEPDNFDTYDEIHNDLEKLHTNGP